MIEQKTILGVKVSYVIASTSTHDIKSMFSLGDSVKEMATKFKADVAANFNYADLDTGVPIGRVIHEGKIVIDDIPKTVVRDELYMSPDGTLHIGKALKGSLWAIQGSPPLLKNGVDVVKSSITRDQLGADIWTRSAIRTAVGLIDNKTLVVVRTHDSITLTKLTEIMKALNCVDSISGDGGGSSYLYPLDNGWGRKLGSGLMIKKKVGNVAVKRVVALCDGHGSETAGKRTPIFPTGHKYGGQFMHENAFNKDVVNRVVAHLQRCGIDVLLVAPTDADTPLKTRTDLANNTIKNKFNRPADIYISVHANALTGTWGTANGIETLWTKRIDERLAKILHKHIMGGTKLLDRGCRVQNLHVTRESDMPAALVECGFMDSLKEAELLMSDAYRSECAIEIARGICEYFETVFVDEKAKSPVVEPKKVDDNVDKVKIKLINTQDKTTMFVDGFVKDGVSYLPIRTTGNFLGATVDYDAATKTPSLTK